MKGHLGGVEDCGCRGAARLGLYLTVRGRGAGHTGSHFLYLAVPIPRLTTMLGYGHAQNVKTAKQVWI